MIKIKVIVGALVVLFIGFYVGMTIYSVFYGMMWDPMIDNDPVSIKFHVEAMIITGVVFSLSSICCGVDYLINQGFDFFRPKFIQSSTENPTPAPKVKKDA